MGYRSEMTIVFYLNGPHPSGAETMPQTPFPVLKLWFDENYPVKEATEEWGALVQSGDDYIKVTYSDVKWYPDYPHVRNVDAAFDLFDAAFDADTSKARGHRESVRIGEESNDIEREDSAYCEYRLNVRRDVMFD